MFCSSCGKKITESSKFCKYCGANQTGTGLEEVGKTNEKDYKTVWTCDYCGKEFKIKADSDSHELKCIQNPKNKKFLQNISPKKGWQYLWVTTMFIFLINIVVFAKYSNEANVDLFNGKFLNTLFFSNIGLGIISFLAVIVSSNKPKNNRVSMFVKNSLIICFFYLLINSLVFAVEGNTAKNNESYRNKYYAGTTPTPVPTIEVKITPTITPKKTVKTNNTQNTNTNTNQGSQIDCIGPDGLQFKTTMEECKKLNETWGKPVDYMVNCNYSDLCADGGGVRYIKKSECDKPCARKSDTTDSSSKTATGNNSNKTAVFLTYSQYTIYCPAQNVGAVTTIDSTMKSKSSEWAKNYNQCSDSFISTDPCYVSCKNTWNTEWNNCYFNRSCMDTANSNQQSCNSKCPSPYISCEWVYLERKNLSSQITNLCK